MLFGLEAASVVKVRLAVLAPVDAGENATLSPQDDDTPKVDPQVLPFVENSPALAPVRAMLVILSVAVPELVKVTAVFPLVVPEVWLPKAMLAGARDTAEAIPVPVRLSVALTVP
jgi:hypothetical protein